MTYSAVGVWLLLACGCGAVDGTNESARAGDETERREADEGAADASQRCATPRGITDGGQLQVISESALRIELELIGERAGLTEARGVEAVPGGSSEPFAASSVGFWIEVRSPGGTDALYTKPFPDPWRTEASNADGTFENTRANTCEARTVSLLVPRVAGSALVVYGSTLDETRPATILASFSVP